MSQKNYETVFIVNPVLSEQQIKDTVAKFKSLVSDHGGDLYHTEDWGLKKLAYAINNKTTGYYNLFEFKADPSFIKAWETEFRRDENVIRQITVHLDRYALEYAEKRRKKGFNKKEEAAS
ncbi:MAG: 30S ribosomal protein S6 [Flammeovirgaceae bacterium]